MALPGFYFLRNESMRKPTIWPPTGRPLVVAERVKCLHRVQLGIPFLICNFWEIREKLFSFLEKKLVPIFIAFGWRKRIFYSEFSDPSSFFFGLALRPRRPQGLLATAAAGWPKRRRQARLPIAAAAAAAAAADNIQQRRRPRNTKGIPSRKRPKCPFPKKQ